MNDWLYEYNEDESYCYRYTLGFPSAVLDKPGSSVFICIGLNPSTARPGELDPTLKQVEKRAKMYGYDGWVMLNLYPQRGTNPNELAKTPNMNEHGHNLDAIEKLFSKIKDNRIDCMIWVAWGTNIKIRDYLVLFLADIKERIGRARDFKWCNIGLTKNNHPHHPLMLSHELRPESFPISSYIDEQLTQENKDLLELRNQLVKILSKKDDPEAREKMELLNLSFPIYSTNNPVRPFS